MKHIYKLSIILVSVFTFIGCNVDDDDPITTAITKDLLASAVEQSEIIGVPNDTENYDFMVQFSEALPSYSTLEYTIDGVTNTVNVNSGATSVAIPLTFSDTESFYDLVLTDFIVVNSSARNFLPSLDGVTSFKVMKVGAFIATMTWDSTADLDLDLDVMTSTWGWAFVTLDASAGFTNSETVSSILDDGNYALWIWTNGSTGQAYTFTITTIQGIQTFTGTVDGNSWNLWITKNGANYTYFTEDPA
tara:strand:+ start:131 stop:871 length:741 start_codon:yes stop_codon:yes gene_type:complete